MDPAEHYERARPVSTRQSLKFPGEVCTSDEVRAARLQADEHLRSNQVAPAFDRVRCPNAQVGIGESGMSEPDMRQFMRVKI